MKKLTQAEFDEFVKEYVYPIIKNRFVDITNSHSSIEIRFVNCVIARIEDEEYVDDHGFKVNQYYFNNCKILDFEKIKTVEPPSYINCTFVKPVPSVCPEEGEFIGYKKCSYIKYDENGREQYIDTCIVKLLIPADAKRSSGFSNKCRCDKAKVLEVYEPASGNKLTGNLVVYSMFASYEMRLYYDKGEWVYPDSFDDDRFNECSNGIHFFMSFNEARGYCV